MRLCVDLSFQIIRNARLHRSMGFIGLTFYWSNVMNISKDVKQVLLWGVKDAPGEWYETKIQAEVRARVLFPIDDPDRRYARVFFKVFYTTE